MLWCIWIQGGSPRVHISQERAHKMGVQCSAGDARSNNNYEGGLRRVTEAGGGMTWRDGAPWVVLTLQTLGPTEAPLRAGDLHALGCL